MHFPPLGRAGGLLAAAALAAHAQSATLAPSTTHPVSHAARADFALVIDSASWRSGAEVTRLNVDSIMRVLPAATVTELLETRVPGLVVSHTSGTPGAPSYLRLRGSSSVALSNAPIVIVDDIRLADVRSTQGYASLAQMTPSLMGQAAPSPIDEIDPHTIDHIDVLPGPAAAAHYGADAAHGAIVITTKRGTVGAPQWSFTASGGRSSPLGDYPVPYIRWGTGPGGTPVLCAYHSGCILDSLPRFQALNDPRYTPFSHGTSAATSLSVSGGTHRITYAVTGSASGQGGIMRLPALEAEHYQSTHGVAPPDWMRDPDFYNTWSGLATVGVELGKGAALTLTSRQFGGVQQTSSLQSMIPLLEGAYINPDTAAASGFLPDYAQHITNNTRAATYGVALEWPVVSWLPIHASFGFDHRQRDDAIRIPPVYNMTGDTMGHIQSGTAAVQTQTATVGTLLPVRVIHGYTIPTAIGITMIREWERIGQLARWYPQDVAMSMTGQDAIPYTTIGAYLEPHLTITPHLSIAPGLRVDHTHVSYVPSHTNLYPSLSAAWEALDAPRLSGWVPATRVHAAYGEAGAQPAPDNRSPILSFGGSFLGAGVLSLGTFVHPERSREIEGGFGLGWLDGRLSVDATVYNRQTSRALVGASVAGFGVPIVNPVTADVRNRGIELLVDAALVQRRSFNWTVSGNLSHNANRVTAVHGLQSNIPADAPDQMHIAVGEPLFGRWTRAIAGYADTNGDGQISTSEVVVQDSFSFAGSEFPPTVMGLNSALSLFNGQLSLHTALEYDDGMTVLNYAAAEYSLSGTSLLQGLASWPTAPFNLQAGAVALPTTLAGAIQSLHVLRWSALAINYTVPRHTAERVHMPGIMLTVQGNNLAMHSNYRGVDPTTTTLTGGTAVADMGQLPMPRTWTFRVTLGS